jgi:hypothetical protein
MNTMRGRVDEIVAARREKQSMDGNVDQSRRENACYMRRFLSNKC